MKVSLPETNSSHLKMDGWNTILSFYLAKSLFFTGKYVSFRKLSVTVACLWVRGGDMRWCLDGKYPTSQTAENFRCVHDQNGRVDVSGLASCQESSGTGVWWWNHRWFFSWFFGQGWWLKVKSIQLYRWWQLKYLFFSPPTWGRFPFWLICFKWVESTN